MQHTQVQVACSKSNDCSFLGNRREPSPAMRDRERSSPRLAPDSGGGQLTAPVVILSLCLRLAGRDTGVHVHPQSPLPQLPCLCPGVRTWPNGQQHRGLDRADDQAAEASHRWQGHQGSRANICPGPGYEASAGGCSHPLPNQTSSGVELCCAVSCCLSRLLCAKRA